MVEQQGTESPTPSPSPTSTIEPIYPSNAKQIHPEIADRIRTHFQKNPLNMTQFDGFLNNKAMLAISAISNGKDDKCHNRFCESLNHFVGKVQDRVNETDEFRAIPIKLHPYKCITAFEEFMKNIGIGTIDAEWLESYDHMVERFGGALIEAMIKAIKIALSVNHNNIVCLLGITKCND